MFDIVTCNLVLKMLGTGTSNGVLVKIKQRSKLETASIYSDFIR